MDSDKHLAKQLDPYKWKKGQSGNPAGRPKGSFSIKDKIRRRLEEHPAEVDAIVAYFVSKNRELMWQMLEGSPKSSARVKVEEAVSVYEPSEGDLELARQFLQRREESVV